VISRRAFVASLAGGILATPLAAGAQQAGKMYRIGLLATRPTPLIVDPFVADMQKYGWLQGRHYILESRFTGGYYQVKSVQASRFSCSPRLHPPSAGSFRCPHQLVNEATRKSGQPICRSVS